MLKRRMFLMMLIMAVFMTACPLVNHQEYYYGNEIDEDFDIDDEDLDIDDEEEELSFDKVHKKYSTKKLSYSKDFSHKNVRLDCGYTNVYPIKVEKAGKYKFTLSDDTYGSFSILLEDSKGRVVKQYDDIYLDFEKWGKTIKLSKGNYILKILSTDELAEYSLFIKSTIVKKTVKHKIKSCDIMQLEPKLGAGTWKTSNKKVVAIEKKKSKGASCVIRAKKAGKATVTYTNKLGSKIKYVITVTKNKNNPFYTAGFGCNYVGGLEPYFVVVNESNSKIKYVRAKVSFYNDVDDIVEDEITGAKTTELTLIGPIKAWNFGTYSFEDSPVFYNGVATKMKIKTVEIEYYGGKVKKIKVNKKYKIG